MRATPDIDAGTSVAAPGSSEAWRREADEVAAALGTECGGA